MTNQTLEKMKNEFLYSVLDFQTVLLALDCVKHCESCPGYRMEYPENVFLECRRTLCDYLEQHAEDLSRLAVYITNRYTGRKRDVFLSKKNSSQN